MYFKLNEHTYTKAFRGFCAHAHDYLFQYMDMSKVTTKSDCPHRLYEASRDDHLQRGLKRALETFDMDTSLTDAEKTLLLHVSYPHCLKFRVPFISYSEFTGVSVGEIIILNARVKDTSIKVSLKFSKT